METPIIFVTSHDSTYDELHALCLGGDDYITKPYNVLVLLARIRSVLRRSGTKSGTEFPSVNGLTLNPMKGQASANGQTIELTRNELQILVCLMEHAGEIVSRAALVEVLWDNQIYIDDNTLSVETDSFSGGFHNYSRSVFVDYRNQNGDPYIAFNCLGICLYLCADL